VVMSGLDHQAVCGDRGWRLDNQAGCDCLSVHGYPVATFGARQQNTYLRAVLNGTRDAGANGWLWWCLRDIRADAHPYVRNGMDRTLGLVDAAGRVKAGLDYFLEFAASVQAGKPAPADTDPIGLYWPRHPYATGDEANPGNRAEDVFRGLAVADAALRAAGRRPRVVTCTYA
jgi:hypothetical protein